MIKKGIFIITMYLLVMNTLSAQNLKETLGGIKTNFQISSDSVNLNVGDQIIILKADKKFYTDCQCGTGYGYGYQSFHLEFTTKRQFTTRNYKFYVGRDNGDKILLRFYDADNNMLASYTSPFDIVDLYNNDRLRNSLFFCSIDLVDIPVLLLNKTFRIDIIKKVAARS
jgi:hypothetical protein